MSTAGIPLHIDVTLETGTADSVRLITIPDWTGVGLMCSREQYPALRGRDVLYWPGVYVLVGPGDAADPRPHLYVGQTNDPEERLDNHVSRKNFWTDLVLFTTSNGGLNIAHCRRIEQRLHDRAKEVGRARLVNTQKPAGPYLGPADQSRADQFLERMLVIYPLLGINAFQLVGAPPTPLPPLPREIWSMRTRTCDATGYWFGRAFMVVKGSSGRIVAVPGLDKGTLQRRDQLKRDGVLSLEAQRLVVTRDYDFGTPSGAATVLAGVSISGPRTWRNAAGKTMGEVPNYGRPTNDHSSSQETDI